MADGFDPGGGQPTTPHAESIEPAGKYYLLSFRHLDAVYAINRKSGKIAWELGGTPTAKSLKILNDPRGAYPLVGQHDARLLPDADLSIRQHHGSPGHPAAYGALPDRQEAPHGQADPVDLRSRGTNSICCGNARLLPSGNWLINWGGTGVLGVYRPNGKRLFKLTTPVGYQNQAGHVLPGALTAEQLLGWAMDAMNG